jgi:hypothetical protein
LKSFAKKPSSDFLNSDILVVLSFPIALAIVFGVLGDFPLTSRIKFAIFHNRNTLYRACYHSEGDVSPSSLFRAFSPIFLALARILTVQIFTALQFILSKIGAVIAQFGRQFCENLNL